MFLLFLSMAFIVILLTGNALTYENEACKPVEVMVPVPQPKKRRALHFPVYVKLFRCSGGCDIEPRLSRCIATGQYKFTTYKSEESFH